MMMLKDYDFSTCENSDDVMSKFDEYAELADQQKHSNSMVKRYIDELNIMKLRGLE